MLPTGRLTTERLTTERLTTERLTTERPTIACATVAPPRTVAAELGAASGPLERELHLNRPLDLGLSLRPLQHGRRDPCVRIRGYTMWRATRTPQGPGVERVTVDPAAARVKATAWGPGAAWLLEALPDLLGESDDGADFDALLTRRPGSKPPPGWDVVASLARRRPGLRMPRTRAVVEALVPTIVEQKVTGIEATRSFRELVTATGTPACGYLVDGYLVDGRPAPGVRAADGSAGPGLLFPPAPAVLAATPSWRMHAWGIERARADTIRRAGAAAGRLEEAIRMSHADAYRRLRALRGIGPWSAATVGLVALGDADAVAVGDFHLPNQVAWMLAGIPRGNDELMLELLRPWRGHRGRVIQLLMAGGVTAPKFGPRQPIRSWRGS
jgi:3-methyladenine DNA glycosylase/8-oxoguanine DNA glycosylase